MIKKMTPEMTEQVLGLWLSETTKAHPFISNAYWARRFLLMRTQFLPSSETYVYLDRGKLLGFISLLPGNHVGALAVEEESQGQGIGTELLNYAMEFCDELHATVYAQNTGAVEFYENRGFSRDEESVNEDTEQMEYTMFWISPDMEEMLFSIEC